MNKYVVAHVDFHNNELNQYIVEAETKPEAIVKFSSDILNNKEVTEHLLNLKQLSCNSWPGSSSTWLEDIKNAFFDMDNLISIIEI